MNLPVYNQNGEKVSEIEIPAILESLKRNDALIHLVMRWQSLNSFHPWAHTKTVGEVRGGGRKPLRQKGTGRARHGTIRSPLWRGGGVTFGPRNEQNRQIKVNIKQKRKAILTVVAEKIRGNSIKVLENLKPETLKTKNVEGILKNFLQPRKRKKYETALVVISSNDTELIKVIRNLPYADAIEARNLNILSLLNHKYLFVEPKGLEIIINTFNKK